MRRSIPFAFSILLLAAVTACTVNPATGQRHLNMLSQSQEILLGQQAAPDFVNNLGGEIPSGQIRQYVSDIGNRLAAVSERPDLPWQFTVVDSQVLNAFALPGGNVFISRGLLEKLEDEAMLAGVLGHEIGHTTAQHIGQQMSRQMVFKGVLQAVGAAASQGNSELIPLLMRGAEVGGGLYLLKFSRDQEHESDHLGIRYLVREGYDPNGVVRVLGVLEREAGGRGASITSTHPDPGERRKRAAAYVAKNYPDANEPGKYVQNRVLFQQTVLNTLASMPPAKHTGK
jgi:predicted Zn-dependent protease